MESWRPPDIAGLSPPLVEGSPSPLTRENGPKWPKLLAINDMLSHALIVGGTGSGKTNCILYMLDLLFNKKEEGTVPLSLFLFDPAGDASIDLVRAIPRSEQSRVVILDLGLPEDDLGKLIVQGDAPLPDASEGGDEKEPGSAEQRAANKGLGSNS